MHVQTALQKAQNRLNPRKLQGYAYRLMANYTDKYLKL